MTPRDRQIQELTARLEDAEAHLAELDRENYGIPDPATESQEHRIDMLTEQLDALIHANARHESRLLIRGGLLLAVLLCVATIISPSVWAAETTPAKPVAATNGTPFDSSGTLSVAYGCDYAGTFVAVGAVAPYLNLSGGYAYTSWRVWLRRAPTWLACDYTLIPHNAFGPIHACDVHVEIAGIDYAISGSAVTSARCY
jgi:hypothetical protein